MSDFQLNLATVSYEGSLFTWTTNCELTHGEGEKQNSSPKVICPSGQLTMTSGFHCCAGSLKSLAISKSGKYLACGGQDERIRIFNMLENKTLGELSTHTGAITALEFFEDSYLISGSEDHTLCIWRVHDWVCVHILGGHKSPITSIAIHPTGKLILSTCRENVLKVWNLVQGRCAFTRRLKAPPVVDGLITTTQFYPTSIQWQHPTGEHYLIVTEKRIEIINAADNSSAGIYDCRHRINQAHFFKTTTAATERGRGDTGGDLERICAIDEGKHLILLEFDGTEIFNLDLTSQGGRLRDLSISSWRSQTITYSFATCCTSNGKMLVLNLNALSDQLSSNSQLSSELLLEKILVASHSLTVEPRFTCTVSWIISSSSSSSSSSSTSVTLPSSKKKTSVKQIENNEGVVDNNSNLTTNDKKKNKKRKNNEIETTQSNEVLVKEPRVRFQDPAVPQELNDSGSKNKKEKKTKKVKKGSS